MKKELLSLDKYSEAILDVELKPVFQIDGKIVSSNECFGKDIPYFQKVTGVKLLLPTYNKRGERTGQEVRTISIEDVRAIAAMIKEIEDRPHENHKYSPEDDLPF